MGDKSPKDKAKKQSQRDTATDQAKTKKVKHQAALDHSPKPTK